MSEMLFSRRVWRRHCFPSFVPVNARPSDHIIIVINIVGSGRDDKEDALCVCVCVYMCARYFFWKLPQPVECTAGTMNGGGGSVVMRRCGRYDVGEKKKKKKETAPFPRFGVWGTLSERSQMSAGEGRKGFLVWVFFSFSSLLSAAHSFFSSPPPPSFGGAPLRRRHRDDGTPALHSLLASRSWVQWDAHGPPLAIPTTRLHFRSLGRWGERKNKIPPLILRWHTYFTKEAPTCCFPHVVVVTLLLRPFFPGLISNSKRDLWRVCRTQNRRQILLVRAFFFFTNHHYSCYGYFFFVRLFY